MAAELARIQAEIERLQRQASSLLADGRAADASTLAATRDYARSICDDSLEEVISGCSRALSLYGFCVIDHVVPGPSGDLPSLPAPAPFLSLICSFSFVGRGGRGTCANRDRRGHGADPCQRDSGA